MSSIDNPFAALSEKLERIEKILAELRAEIRNSSTNVGNDEGVSLAVAVTGLKKKTIYNLVSRKEIPHYKKGGRLYFDKEELTARKRSGKHLALQEISTVPVVSFPVRRTSRGRHAKLQGENKP